MGGSKLMIREAEINRNQFVLKTVFLQQNKSGTVVNMQNSEPLCLLSTPGLIVNNECFFYWEGEFVYECVGARKGVHRLQAVLVCL